MMIIQQQLWIDYDLKLMPNRQEKKEVLLYIFQNEHSIELAAVLTVATGMQLIWFVHL